MKVTGIAIIAGLLVGLAGGAALAWYETGQIDNIAGRGSGPWKTTSGTGDATGNAFLRASVARVGIWGLPQSEVVYFRADTDSQDRPLDPRCEYSIKASQPLPARWWSVGVYSDYFWIPNPANRYSYSGTSIAYQRGTYWEIALSPTRKPGNWLPTKREGRLTILLRLYQPDPSVAREPEKVSLPVIERQGCPEGILSQA